MGQAFDVYTIKVEKKTSETIGDKNSPSSIQTKCDGIRTFRLCYFNLFSQVYINFYFPATVLNGPLYTAATAAAGGRNFCSVNGQSSIIFNDPVSSPPISSIPGHDRVLQRLRSRRVQIETTFSSVEQRLSRDDVVAA